ncbi:hypothetical protein SLEP1_g55754 [Rubroshorea leprosula]|uniref:Uncharacterized protein n=1 Tax=Rubroshorea leprosula TaxID=152421 RepID=A0AAV5MK73_9ROSI|nr:hypothetical protein SLEP1_g55754 [Rubroshorea leprosula]
MDAGALFFSANVHSLYKPKNPPDISTGSKASPVRTQFRVGSTIGSMFSKFRYGIRARKGAGNYTQMLDKYRSRYGNW